MALVFDLDETLLVANTNSSLENRIEDCKRQRSVAEAELWGRGGKVVMKGENRAHKSAFT